MDPDQTAKPHSGGEASEVTEAKVEDGTPVVLKSCARIRLPVPPALISLRTNVFKAGDAADGARVEELVLEAGESRTRVINLRGR